MPDLAPVVSFDRSSPVHAYWLANCEGFRVREGAKQGVVERIELDPDGQVSELVVSFGMGRRRTIQAHEVETVVPAEEVLLLPIVERPPAPPRLAPAARRSAVVGATAWHATGRGSRAVWLRTRAVTVAGGREAGRFARWSSPRIGQLLRRAAVAVDVGAARVVPAIYSLVCSARTQSAPAARSTVSAVAGAWQRGREGFAEGRRAEQPTEIVPPEPAVRDAENEPAESGERDRAA